MTIDGDGYLTVVGRKKEIVIRGGINIAPREIEDLLVSFPEVERAAVVGLPDPRLGERCCACVVLAPGARIDLATVVARLRDTGTGHLQAARAPRDPRRPAHHRVGQDPKARDRAPPHEWPELMTDPGPILLDVQPLDERSRVATGPPQPSRPAQPHRLGHAWSPSTGSSTTCWPTRPSGPSW